VGLTGYGKQNKVGLCLVLLDFKAQGGIVPTETEASEKVTINRCRYPNVLFSNVIRPLLATKGRSLNKDQLTEGVKKDEELHDTIALEYNKEDAGRYSRNVFPEIQSGRSNNTSVFGEISWQKSAETFIKLTGEYNKCFYMWKLSGFHGDFPEDPDVSPGDVKLPFSDFVDNNFSLLYIHEFVFSFPDYLVRITCDLPEDSFSESTGIVSIITGASPVNVVSVSSKKRKAKKAKDDDDMKCKSRLGQSIARTMEKKNREIEFAVLADLVGNLGDKMFVLQDRKSILTARLEDTCGGRTSYKRRMKAMRERRRGDDVEEEYSSDGDSDEESQASQMERVLELTVEIGRMKKMQCMTNN